MKRARDGAVDERCVRDVDQVGEDRRGNTGIVPGPPAIEKIVEKDRQASHSCE